MGFDAGNVNFPVTIVPTDHPQQETSSAISPLRSSGTSPSEAQGLESTITPAIPIASPIARRNVSRCVRRNVISSSVMQTGIMARITAAMPDGTRCSAQNRQA